MTQKHKFLDKPEQPSVTNGPKEQPYTHKRKDRYKNDQVVKNQRISQTADRRQAPADAPRTDHGKSEEHNIIQCHMEQKSKSKFQLSENAKQLPSPKQEDQNVNNRKTIQIIQDAQKSTPSSQEQLPYQVKLEKTFKKTKLSDEKQEKMEYVEIQKDFGDMLLLNKDEMNIVNRYKNQYMKKCSDFQEKAINALFETFFSGPNGIRDSDVLKQIAREVITRENTTIIETDIGEIEKDQLENYLSICTEHDTDKYMERSSDGKFAVPSIVRRRLLGMTSKRNIVREYQQSFVNELNKYSTTQYPELVRAVLGILLNLAGEPQQDRGETLQIFRILITEIFEKACMETKFIEMYTELLLKLSSYKTYKRLERGAAERLHGMLHRICEQFVLEHVNDGGLPKSIKNCVRFQDGKMDFSDEEILEKIFYEQLILRLINDEIETGRASSGRFAEREGETALETQTRLTNLAVHFAGCIQFVGTLFLQDRKERLLRARIFQNFLVLLVRSCFNEVEGSRERQDEFRNTSPKSDSRALEKRIAMFQGAVDRLVQTKTKIEAPMLNNYVKLLERTMERIEGTEGFDKDYAAYIKRVLWLYTEDVIPNHIYFRIHEKIFRDARPAVREQEVQITIDARSADFQELMDLWRESSLKEVVSMYYGVQADRLVDAIRKDQGKLLQFVREVFQMKKHELLVKELNALVREAFQREHGCAEFMEGLARVVYEHAQTRDNYDSVFRMLARMYQDKHVSFCGHVLMLLGEDGGHAERVRGFVEGVTASTVLNSFSWTLDEQYADLLSGAQVDEVRALIGARKFFEVGELGYLVERFRKERFSYFGEPDAQPHVRSLLNPFDCDAIDALRALYEVYLPRDQIRNFLQRFYGLFKNAQDDRVPQALYNLFDGIGFGCGVQAFYIIGFQNNTVPRKLLVYQLEYAIKECVEQERPESIERYVQENGVQKHITACVLDKLFAYCKTRYTLFNSMLDQLSGMISVGRAVELVNKYEESGKNYGAVREIVAHVRRMK